MKTDFKVEFIFGTSTAHLSNLQLNKRLALPLQDTVSEANFRQIFADVTDALLLSGLCGDKAVVDCLTFPAGTRIVYPTSVD